MQAFSLPEVQRRPIMGGQVEGGEEPRTGVEPTTPATASPQDEAAEESTDTDSHPAEAPSSSPESSEG